MSLLKNPISAVAIGIAIIISAYILGNAFVNRYQSSEVIEVTGLGKKDFDSDLIVWRGSFSRKSMNLEQAYEMLDSDREKIKTYLSQKNISSEEIIFSAVDIQKDYKYVYVENGRSYNEFAGYILYQTVKLESTDVDKIESLSREITELIRAGVELNADAPQYFYTRLSELKREMISEATEDARIRAEIIAEKGNSQLGKLVEADMGVFQIIAQNSNEDYSWGGTYNTSSRKKTATITMKLKFQIR